MPPRRERPPDAEVCRPGPAGPECPCLPLAGSVWSRGLISMMPPLSPGGKPDWERGGEASCLVSGASPVEVLRSFCAGGLRVVYGGLGSGASPVEAPR
eukprot:1703780-Lingulodinium_polyedra.AAC.1